jgi:hypothetical protein
VVWIQFQTAKDVKSNPLTLKAFFVLFSQFHLKDRIRKKCLTEVDAQRGSLNNTTAEPTLYCADSAVFDLMMLDDIYFTNCRL